MSSTRLDIKFAPCWREARYYIRKAQARARCYVPDNDHLVIHICCDASWKKQKGQSPGKGEIAVIVTVYTYTPRCRTSVTKKTCFIASVGDNNECASAGSRARVSASTIWQTTGRSASSTGKTDRLPWPWKHFVMLPGRTKSLQTRGQKDYRPRVSVVLTPQVKILNPQSSASAGTRHRVPDLPPVSARLLIRSPYSTRSSGQPSVPREETTANRYREHAQESNSVKASKVGHPFLVVAQVTPEDDGDAEANVLQGSPLAPASTCTEPRYSTLSCVDSKRSKTREQVVATSSVAKSVPNS